MSVLNFIQSILHKASGNKKLYVFLSCLSLTFFFWLLNALDNSYVTNVNFEINYVNQPEGYVVLNDLPDELNIKVKGLGYDLLAYQLKIKDNVIRIDLSQLKNIRPKQNLFQSSLNFNVFKPTIFTQLGSQIELNEIYPKQVDVFLDHRSKKLIQVKPDINLEFEQQFHIYGNISVKPAVVNISGPKSILDTLEYVETKTIEYSDVDESITESVSFKPEYKNKKVSFDNNQVLVSIPVEKFTEYNLSITLDQNNVPDSIDLKVIPGNISLKFLLPLSKVNSINERKVNASVDYNDILNYSGNKLKVQLNKYPEYFKNITIKPSKVEYIVKKK